MTWDQKQRLGFRKGKSKNKFSFGLLSVNKIFRLDHRQEATSVPFIFYTRCCISPNRSRSHADHMVSQWISDATLLFLVKMKRVTKCWKTTIFCIEGLELYFSTCHFETKLRAQPELASYLLLATARALVVHISTSQFKYFPKIILLAYGEY